MSSSASSRGRPAAGARPGRRGAAAAEFALVGAALLVAVLAALDLGRYALTMHSLRTAAADAARAAVVHARAADCGAAAVRDAARAGILGPTLGLTVTCPRIGGITTVTVTATRPFRFVVPVLGTSSLTLTENASFRFAS